MGTLKNEKYDIDTHAAKKKKSFSSLEENTKKNKKDKLVKW